MKGRKRHNGADSQGHLLDVEVTAANVHDTNAGVCLLDGVKMKHDRIQAFCGDAAYRGNASWYSEILLETLLQICRKVAGEFQVIPQRWIVERTLAWLSNSRRLSKDYEVNPDYSENIVRIAMVRLTLKRIQAEP
ncbi:MAG: transposase [bacterium]|nr:transposase [bacterium]